jgi:uncharacterized protein (TIGR03083 family)
MAETSARAGGYPEPRQSLQLLETEQRRLCAALLALTPAQFDLPSNLPGWRILDLGVHITRVCDSILLAVQRATVGDETPAFGPAARPREAEIRTMTPAAWVDLQRNAYQHLTRIVAELTDDQLDQLHFPHPQGQRSIRWFCTQLLAEVAFHRWDLAASLGSDAALDDTLAAYLLPFLLDPAEPLFGMLRTQSGDAQFSLTSTSRTWVLTATNAGTAVEQRVDGGGGPWIQAAPGWLALAVYGRVRIDAPAFTIAGPADTADRFAAIFGPRA